MHHNKENELTTFYREHPVSIRLRESLGQPDKNRISLTGLTGSVKAAIVSDVFM
jgi:hypothetical protein